MTEAYRDDSDAGITQEIAINRLSPDDSFVNPIDRIWTIEEVRQAAVDMGKKFTPADEIKDRLADDLANGALVLFTEAEVEKAIADNLISCEYRVELINLVTNEDDIAVIPKT